MCANFIKFWTLVKSIAIQALIIFFLTHITGSPVFCDGIHQWR